MLAKANVSLASGEVLQSDAQVRPQLVGMSSETPLLWEAVDARDDPMPRKHSQLEVESVNVFRPFP
eukprot:COSAG04_NODE_982_length_9008_cov_3.598720_3_plen_66_part_00